MKTLVVLAHPDLTASRVNKALKNAIENEVVLSDLYAKYKDFKFNIPAEQELLVQSNKIVFQFPIFWYSYPPLLQKYFDDVFAYGFACGSSGQALKGKELALCVSLGGKEEAYSAQGMVGFGLEELLSPFKATSKFVGAKYGGHFAVFGATQGLSDTELAKKCHEYKGFVA
ncbi:putative NAD(P)H oxidoreductase YdeQ [Helicobacter suis]|uniref:NAD(P)H oxidoreductase YdeQ n=1 Tax=Helicobacter suis TaxID=104628 RepID=A0ABM7L0Z2_9HELI|nr:NAD(P)H-dependent oxidoreductase [Helicobacter suis]BCD46350.1 putative NAD(P)H oxidoreductase YdeQ [Helicobacter suis]GFK15979.1 putative NAD(P)H oxidoreductase YdeQ [Helicobacter suis]